jgi:hypothetical protein
MDDNGLIAFCAALAIALCFIQSKRIDRLEREMDLIVDGDMETLKLRRKLDGIRTERDES